MERYEILSGPFIGFIGSEDEWIDYLENNGFVPCSDGYDMTALDEDLLQRFQDWCDDEGLTPDNGNLERWVSSWDDKEV